MQKQLILDYIDKLSKVTCYSITGAKVKENAHGVQQVSFNFSTQNIPCKFNFKDEKDLQRIKDFIFNEIPALIEATDNGEALYLLKERIVDEYEAWETAELVSLPERILEDCYTAVAMREVVEAVLKTPDDSGLDSDAVNTLLACDGNLCLGLAGKLCANGKIGCLNIALPTMLNEMADAEETRAKAKKETGKKTAPKDKPSHKTAGKVNAK